MMSISSSSTGSDSDTDDCDMGPWQGLPIDSMMLTLNIQKLEGEARHQKYHEKLAKLKERQENLLQRKVARLKQEGIHIDVEALKRRSKPRLKRSAWAGDDDDDHRRRGKQKALDNSDEESDDMYVDSDEGSDESNQEPRDYAEWYARQYGFESESPRRKSAGAKSKQKKNKKSKNVKIAQTSAGSAKVNTFRTLRNVISATHYLERKVLARKAATNAEQAESKPELIVPKPPELEDKPAEVTTEEPPTAVPDKQEETVKASGKEARSKFRRLNFKMGATMAFRENNRTKKKPLGSKKGGT